MKKRKSTVAGADMELDKVFKSVRQKILAKCYEYAREIDDSDEGNGEEKGHYHQPIVRAIAYIGAKNHLGIKNQDVRIVRKNYRAKVVCPQLISLKNKRELAILQAMDRLLDQVTTQLLNRFKSENGVD